MPSESSDLTYRSVDVSFALRAWLGNYVYNNVASNSGYYQQLTRSSPYNLSTSVLKTGFVTNQQLSDIYVTKPVFKTEDRKSTRLNSSHSQISYAVFCLKKKT